MISILIPTSNQPELVARLLRYYAEAGFDGCLCLGDASDAPAAARNRELVDAYSGRLNILYRPEAGLPNARPEAGLRELAEMTSTPCVVWSGDQHFLVPATLKKCAQFLAAHPDYSAASGMSIELAFQEGSSGLSKQVRCQETAPLEAPRAAARWQSYMRQPFSIQAWVCPRAAWQRMWQDRPHIPLEYLGREVLPGSWAAILGKMAVLSDLGCAVHPRTGGPAEEKQPTFYELMLDPNWVSAMRALRASLARGLAESDGMPLPEAEAAFDHYFWDHLLLRLDQQFRLHYPASSRNAYDHLRRQKWLQTLYSALRRQRPDAAVKNIDLSELLRPGARYQADFAPIYKAIASQEQAHAR